MPRQMEKHGLLLAQQVRFQVMTRYLCWALLLCVSTGDRIGKPLTTKSTSFCPSTTLNAANHRLQLTGDARVMMFLSVWSLLSAGGRQLSLFRWALTPVGFRWAPTFGGGVVWQSHRVVRAVIVSCREIGRVDQP